MSKHSSSPRGPGETSQGSDGPSPSIPAEAPHTLPPLTEQGRLAHRLITLVDGCLAHDTVARALRAEVEHYGGFATLRSELTRLSLSEDVASGERLLSIQRHLLPSFMAEIWKRNALACGIPPAPSLGNGYALEQTSRGESVLVRFKNSEGHNALDLQSGRHAKGFSQLFSSPTSERRFVLNKQGSELTDFDSGEVLNIPDFGALGEYIKFSPNGKEAITPFYSSEGSGWIDLISRRKIPCLIGVPTTMRCPSFSPDGRDVYGKAFIDNTPQLIDLRTGEAVSIASVTPTQVQEFGVIHFSANSKIAIVPVKVGYSWRFLNLNAGALFEHHGEEISSCESVSVSPRGDSAFAVVRCNHERVLYDILAGRQVKVEGHSFRDPRVPLYSPSGRAAYVGVGVGDSYKLLDLTTSSFVRIPASQVDHIGEVYFSVFAEDCYAPIHADGGWKLLRVDTGTIIPIPGPPPNLMGKMCFSPNGREGFLSLREGSTWKLLNINTGALHESPDGKMLLPVFSQDSSRAFAFISDGGNTPRLQILDVLSGKVIPLPKNSAIAGELAQGTGASVLVPLGLPDDVYILDLSGDHIANLSRARAASRSDI